MNAGLDKLKFSTPVPSDSRVRLHAEIESARSLRHRGMRTTFALRIEVEGDTKPALTALARYLYLTS